MLVMFTSPSSTLMMIRLPRSPSMMLWSSVSPSSTTLPVRFLAHPTPSVEPIHSQVLRSSASAMPRDTSPPRMILDSTSNTGESRAPFPCLKLRSRPLPSRLSRLPPSRRPSLRPSRSRIPAVMSFQPLAKSATTIAQLTLRRPSPLRFPRERLLSHRNSPSLRKSTSKSK